ncbi:MAG TPA: carbamoyl-phosphate synthase large subunit, partial [Polyangiaceae bacterium]|nr:carbamoyl-phosphate synthase large subunit [Polyangiaceae bacterium]
MPKRTDVQKILLVGAGPIVIGQACEFDYSGTQGAKALREEGYDVVLVNSNPATIMTDPELIGSGGRTYVEPLEPRTLEAILERERPQAILPTLGGQTALNLALALHERGVLKRLNIEMLGAKPEAIAKAEDRALFKAAMEKVGLECPRAGVAHSVEDAWKVVAETGFPAILRPSFTLGGTGGGIAYTKDELGPKVAWALSQSPTHEVLIEESVLGWKEYELEVIRDRKDNFIVVCSIENIDPMGVHTGDSITVAPAMTLTDREYQRLRDAARAVMTEIGVETGGSNVQFAVSPKDGRVLVIEMNPRVSRSSALASKATGYPIAKVAAKLAVGYTLDELKNDITGTSAAFEPAIDYVVVKWPRFAFEKFPGADSTLGTQMKSVGEVMSIGRTFCESIQKAARSLETGKDGLGTLLDRVDYRLLAEPKHKRDLVMDAPELVLPKSLPPASPDETKSALMSLVGIPTADRLFYVVDAMRLGATDEELHDKTKIDPWFLAQLRRIVDMEKKIATGDLDDVREYKRLGFSDRQIAKLAKTTEDEVRKKRKAAGVAAVYAQVDTCAAEFPARTNYLYSAYESETEAPKTDKKKVVILGGGPNRIGQGIEFDYCCCHACFALNEVGYETIMVNCNPETVSTDYDTSDRLYFEPLTAEDVIEIIDTERSNGTLHGVIVQFGGQTPLKLAEALEKAKVPILGTSPDAIDLAEDRDRFKQLLEKLKLRQPQSGIATSLKAARASVESIGYPVVIRPSYVLGGRAMEIVHDSAQLDRYLARLTGDLDRPSELVVSAKRPLLIDRYLTDAIEVDVDCLCDGKDTYIAGIMEHIEEAGIHSGDSACSLPPYSLDAKTIAELERHTRALALALNVGGLMNVQYAIKDGDIYILEVNPRASRTVPFVAKVIGLPVAKIAARIMAGEKLASFKLPQLSFELKQFKHVGVKEAVFPFGRFGDKVDTLLGPEMKSTGEVMGLDLDYSVAFA